METTYGTCMYCGQTMMIKTSGEIDQEKADLIAVEHCVCDGAVKARSEDELNDQVRLLFGDDSRRAGFEYVCGEDEMKMLRDMSFMVLIDAFDEIKVKLRNGDVATMKLLGGVVSISREMKKKKTV